jgi:hypothetical protein
MIRKVCYIMLGAAAFLVLGVVLAHVILIGGLYAFKGLQTLPKIKPFHHALVVPAANPLPG